MFDYLDKGQPQHIIELSRLLFITRLKSDICHQSLFRPYRTLLVLANRDLLRSHPTPETQAYDVGHISGVRFFHESFTVAFHSSD